MDTALKKNKKRDPPDPSKGDQGDGDALDYAPERKLAKSLVGPPHLSHIQQAALDFVATGLEKIKDKLQAPKPGQIVDLPLPPYGNLTPRFVNVKSGENIPCIQRQAFLDLKSFVDKKEGLTYVNGPIGFGKSFALYHLYCTLSLYPSYRVLYIPDCSVFGMQPYELLIEAFTSAFAPDLAFLNQSLPHLAAESPHWLRFLRELANHCSTNHLTFVAIIDQHNGLKGPARFQEPTNFPVWTRNLPGAKIIISASANNEDTPIKLDDKKASYWFGDGYSSTELGTWQQRANFFGGQDLSALTELCQNSPFELSSLEDIHKAQPTLALAEVQANWQKTRTKEMRASHDEYFAKLASPGDPDLTTKRRHAYNRAIHHIASQVPVPPGTAVEFDRQLFFRSSDDVISPVIPIAREMIMLDIQTFDAEEWTTSTLQNVAFDNAMLGKAVEYYLIHRITTTRSIKLTAKEIEFTAAGTQSKNSTTKEVALDNLGIVRFPGSHAPPSLPTANTVFFPINSNYPDIDIFVCQMKPAKPATPGTPAKRGKAAVPAKPAKPAKTVLWAIQVTVGRDPDSHADSWHAGQTVYDDWNAFLTQLKDPVTQLQQPVVMRKLWITATPMKKNFAGSFFCDIVERKKELKAAYPALEHFLWHE